MRRPAVLVVLDGWGEAPPGPGNAVSLAETPVWDQLMARCPHAHLRTDGEAVGLSPGQMGNSNVGHLNLGAGRVVYQDLVRIDRAIAGGEFQTNPVLLELLRGAQRVHLLGLVSDGGVHSHLRHLLALLDLARNLGTPRVFVHSFLDGRDVPPRSAGRYLEELERHLAAVGNAATATVMGRYWAMDRDRRWDRTRRAWQAMVAGEGHRAATAAQALEQAYARGENDEFVEPTVVDPAGVVRPGDAVFCFNFRADRARQITQAFTDPAFAGFPREFIEVRYASMTRYDETFTVPYAFAPIAVRNGLGEVWSKAGLRQLRIAETEKYAHVTYFFNGGEEEPYPGEERVLVPSPKVATYDLQPQMSAPQVTQEAVARIRSGRYDAVVLNYANADMVGHTGVLEAAVQAVETVDQSLGRLLAAVEDQGGFALICADHGNIERMREADGTPHTAHTTNPVPLVLVGGPPGAGLADGILADVAPTLLGLEELAVPPEMTGKSLLRGT